MNNCPKCNAPLPADFTDTECPRCGVIFAKYFAAQAQKVAKDTGNAVSTPPPGKAEEPASPTRRKNADEKFCQECGEVIRAKAEICPKCGVRQPNQSIAFGRPEFPPPQSFEIDEGKLPKAPAKRRRWPVVLLILFAMYVIGISISPSREGVRSTSSAGVSTKTAPVASQDS